MITIIFSACKRGIDVKCNASTYFINRTRWWLRRDTDTLTRWLDLGNTRKLVTRNPYPPLQGHLRTGYFATVMSEQKDKPHFVTHAIHTKPHRGAVCVLSRVKGKKNRAVHIFLSRVLNFIRRGIKVSARMRGTKLSLYNFSNLFYYNMHVYYVRMTLPLCKCRDIKFTESAYVCIRIFIIESDYGLILLDLISYKSTSPFLPLNKLHIVQYLYSTHYIFSSNMICIYN